MPRYLIVRTFEIDEEAMPDVGRRSKEIAREEFPEIAWEHSHVIVRDSGSFRQFCVYQAPDPETPGVMASAWGAPHRRHLGDRGDVRPPTSAAPDTRSAPSRSAVGSLSPSQRRSGPRSSRHQGASELRGSTLSRCRVPTRRRGPCSSPPTSSESRRKVVATEVPAFRQRAQLRRGAVKSTPAAALRGLTDLIELSPTGAVPA
jgi:hypothetical protein